jgi:hypothetical protein
MTRSSLCRNALRDADGTYRGVLETVVPLHDEG